MAGTLEIQVDGQDIFRLEQVSVLRDSTQPLGRLAHRLEDDPRKLTLSLRGEHGQIAYNQYHLAWTDNQKSSLYQRFRRWGADWVLRKF